MSGSVTRARIVEAADELFYQHGYEHTSFAAIADEVRISRGNFYYHFKSKDEILDAVIDARVGARRAMLEQWEADEPTPGGRIRRFIHIVLTNRADIQNHGCPVGTLTTELAKLDHAALKDAKGLFEVFRVWLREQFALLGHEAQADALAMHVLAFSQGVATLANAFHDEEFICREVQRMCDWLSAYTGDAEQDVRDADAQANA
ncbi:TetR/AcrR family transcriptional regulator [Phytoactinopolyspora endophytica]|uniref:TetR/AcrR family transcriptional regulator n=1 Tax=Phytoactinopolyspora endophytica TaxID=1642495 RepID=UPI00101BBF0F|nr:TetR/AcrR family transcriptional regulator [Phytoactinopolyspora endophytica]